MRVDALLAQARSSGVARLDAQLIVAHHTGRTRTWVLAHDDADVDALIASACSHAIQQRASGRPLAYLLGHREFHGLDLQVDDNVLIPRPETEILVEWALERVIGLSPCRVIDLGTGSGAIALAIRAAAPQAEITATDRSDSALTVARANGDRLGLAVNWAQGDWWDAVPDRRFELAVSNPPYIAGDDAHLDALTHEPRGALTPEGDGSSALARIVLDAPTHLQPGAWLLLEHGHDQAAVVRRMLAERGFTDAETRPDLAGIDRCTGARWPG